MAACVCLSVCANVSFCISWPFTVSIMYYKRERILISTQTLYRLPYPLSVHVSSAPIIHINDRASWERSGWTLTIWIVNFLEQQLLCSCCWFFLPWYICQLLLLRLPLAFRFLFGCLFSHLLSLTFYSCCIFCYNSFFDSYCSFLLLISIVMFCSVSVVSQLKIKTYNCWQYNAPYFIVK